MTIQGFYFTPGYAENTVVFVAQDGRVSYVRSEHSTKTTITVIVPKKIERLLPLDGNGTQGPDQVPHQGDRAADEPAREAPRWRSR